VRNEAKAWRRAGNRRSGGTVAFQLKLWGPFRVQKSLRVATKIRGDMRLREPWPAARSRQRRRECDTLFYDVPLGSLGDGLEIGGGDGFLASLVGPRCRSFVTTDSYRPRLADGAAQLPSPINRLVCEAARLPFIDASFDFIFSSSVLEHIRDRGSTYRELRRCLRPGGVMIHIVPSRTWKLLQLLFYYPHQLMGGVDLALDALVRAFGPSRKTVSARACDMNRWSDRRRLTLRLILENVVPQPHGEYPGNIAELRAFGVRSWKHEFAAAGLATQQVIQLPLYSGYGFGLERLRRIGERLGLSSHNAFVLTAGDSCALDLQGLACGARTRPRELRAGRQGRLSPQ
jgi:SAM-dependent methyltransferase